MKFDHDTSKVAVLGYNIRNCREGVASSGCLTYECELWYRDVKVAHYAYVSDKHDPIITWCDRIEGQAVIGKVVSDLSSLVRLMGDRIHPDSLVGSLCVAMRTLSMEEQANKAVCVWFLLLEEFNRFVAKAEKAKTKVLPEEYYFVAAVGLGVCTQQVAIYTGSERVYAGRIPSIEDTVRIVSNIVGHREASDSTSGLRMYALAILRGSMNWVLAAEDFVELYTPYSYLKDYTQV